LYKIHFPSTVTIPTPTLKKNIPQKPDPKKQEQQNQQTDLFTFFIWDLLTHPCQEEEDIQDSGSKCPWGREIPSHVIVVIGGVFESW